MLHTAEACSSKISCMIESERLGRSYLEFASQKKKIKTVTLQNHVKWNGPWHNFTKDGDFNSACEILRHCI